MKRKIILASSSPRRRELLTSCGLTFEIISPECDESILANESAESMVKRLSLLKAETVAKNNKDALVIGADTTVLLGSEILGKPQDEKDARAMLKKIQGKTHVVWGGIAVVCLTHRISEVKAYGTDVLMKAMTDNEIAKYVATKEPLDKAGSYAIQGIGLQYVDSINGSYSNVVGLDVGALMSTLRELHLLDES